MTESYTNFYLTTLARELNNHCLQYTTPNGDLSTGGLGPWVYLQYQASFQNHKERDTLLLSARDAALECLKTAKSKQDSISIYTNEVIGAHAMLAVIHFQRKGSDDLVQHHIHKVLTEIRRSFPTGDCDVMYGRAGALQTIFFLRRHLSKPNLGISEVVNLVHQILKEGQRVASLQDNYDRAPLLWKWRGTAFLGAAHGLVGILTSLLGLANVELKMVQREFPNFRDLIQQTIDTLPSHCYPSGNLRVTLVGIPGSDRQVEWAHGAPGYILLLLRAYETYGNVNYKDRAQNLAEQVVWARRKLYNSVNLMSGLSGVAYAFIRVYQITQDPLWRNRVEQLARYSVNHWKDSVSSRPYSLFEGVGGLVSLLLDLGDTNGFSFPFFDQTAVSQQHLPQTSKNTFVARTTLARTVAESKPATFENPHVGLSRRASLDDDRHYHLDGADDYDNTEGEFGVASDSDTPVESFLRAQYSHHENEDLLVAAEDRRRSAETLDVEKHDDLGVLMDSTSRSGDEDEFAGASDRDKPVDQFLRAQASFQDNGELLEGTDLANRSIDDETHYDLGDMIDLPDGAEEEIEFGVPDEEDRPVERYLEAQDSMLDLFYADCELTRQPTPQQILEKELDVDKHEDLGVLVHLREDLYDAEFQTADLNERPVAAYLRAQDSQDDLYYEFTRPSGKKSLLDDEGHTPIVDRTQNGEELAVDDFQLADAKEKPVEMYLRAQDSQDDLYFENHSNYLEQKEIRQLSINSAKSFTTPACDESKLSRRMKGKTSTFASAATVSTTPQRLTSNPQQGAETPSRSVLDISTISGSTPGRRQHKMWRAHDTLMAECLRSSRGEGNLLTGGLGTAVYLRVKQSELENGEKRKLLLQTAFHSAKLALRHAEHLRGKFKPTLLAGEYVGSKCMVASILYKMGKKEAAHQHALEVVERLEDECAKLSGADCSIVCGLAGALQAVWFLRQELEAPRLGKDFAVTTTTAILMEGLKQGEKLKTDSLLMWQWRGRAFLGAANGVVGILHALLGHANDEWNELNAQLPRAKEIVKQAIDSLQGLRHTSGNLRASLDDFDEDNMCDWSHGSPGYCLLLIKASDIFDDERYLALAKDMAEKVLWPRRMQRKGLGLLRGTTGIAYIFLALSRVDSEQKDLWLSRAEQIAQSAICDLTELLAPSNRPNSLFEGLGGFVALLMDILNPKEAFFPFNEIPSASADQECGVLLSEKPIESGIGQLLDHGVQDHGESQRPADVERPKTKALKREKSVEKSIPRRVEETDFKVVESRSASDCAHVDGSVQARTGMFVDDTDSKTEERNIKVVESDTVFDGAHVNGSLQARTGMVVDDTGSQARNVRLVLQLMNTCLQNTIAEGNLSKGGLGPTVFLRLKMAHSLHHKSGGGRIQYLKAALEEAKAAVVAAEKRSGAFYVSLFAGDYVGSKCLQAAILFNLGHKDEAFFTVGEVIATLEEACADLPTEECEVSYGRAGALQAIWFLRQEFKDTTIGREFALATSKSILIEGLEQGKDNESDSLLMWRWHGKRYLGAAHGVVGILHTLLGHTEEEWEQLEVGLPRVKDVIQQAIGSLENLRHPSGNLRTSLGRYEEDRHTEWAHGSPGYCLLLIKAAEAFNNLQYLELAASMAEHVIWPRRVQRSGLGLTHGSCGIAYVFLALAQVDAENSALWRSRAEHYALGAIDESRHLTCRSTPPYSIGEGLGGLVCLLMDLGITGTAPFPFYEYQIKQAKMTTLNPRRTPSMIHSNNEAKSSSVKRAQSSGRTAQEPSQQRHFSTSKPILQPGAEAKKAPVDVIEESFASLLEVTTPSRGHTSTPSELLVTPKALKTFLTEKLPADDILRPALLSFKSHAGVSARNEETQGRATLLAQELLHACLRRNTAEGNLYSGGIGPWVFLQMKMTHHLMRHPAMCHIGSMQALKSAREAVFEALRGAEERRGPFHVSILSGEWVGAKCLLASVLYNSGDAPAARSHADDVISKLKMACVNLPSLECDVMYGRSGILQSIWYLRQELEDPDFGRNFALATSLSILAEGFKMAKRKDIGWLLLWDWKEKSYLGAANGVTGILHSILGHSETELNLLEEHLPKFRDAIKHTIHKLNAHRNASGNIRAIFDCEEYGRLLEWVHGAPGYCLMLIRAAEMLNEPAFLDQAKDMADTVLWPRRNTRIGVGLSTGMSGVGYVFLALARVDVENRKSWKEQAEFYVEAAVSNWGDLLELSNNPYSLYEGLGGLVSLILDLENIESGHFPFFETKSKMATQVPAAIKVEFSGSALTANEDTPKTGNAITSTTMSVSQLTNPNAIRSRHSLNISPKVSPKVFPKQRKLHNYTKADHVPLAEKTTTSSRAKAKRDKANASSPSGSPSIRMLVGGFERIHNQ